MGKNAIFIYLQKGLLSMWIADGWKDYEVIDTSKGEKLERWGDYLLIRPDPQVIWDTPREHRGWRKPDGHYHRSKKEAVNGNSSASRNSGRFIIKN